jgi:hypothetical protein
MEALIISIVIALIAYEILDIVTRPKPIIKNCKTCKFNCDTHCNVGTYYAEQGLNRICYEGELWKGIS